MSRVQYAPTVSVNTVVPDHRIVRVCLALLKVFCWLCVSPLFLLGFGITLFYLWGIFYAFCTALTRFDALAAVVVATVISYFIGNGKMWSKIDANEGEPDLPYSGELVVMSVSQFASLMTALLLPGVLAMVVFFVSVQSAITQILSSLPGGFPIYLVTGVLCLLPLSLTWRVSAHQTSFRFVARHDRLYTRQKSAWQVTRLVDVAQLKVRRSARVSEKSYDEDDQSQHSIVLVKNNGEEVDIELAAYSLRDRRRIFAWFQKKVAAPLIDPKAVSLLQEKKTMPAPKPLNNAAIPEAVNFTTMWQADYNAHMERTNYVPLGAGHQLQNGRYSVLAYLNSGGFCTTYLCNDTSGQRVVVKESSLPASLSDDAKKQVSEMFAREARLLQRCSHERIARILDFFHESEREYLVLEYIDGAPLSDLVRRSGPVAEKQVVIWLRQMGDFLRHLHELEPPIVHRDFTPQNLLVHRSGDLHLIDFGAANDFIGQATGTLIGKQSYIAPEQLQGKACAQSDIYGLGATAYFLLTGKDPLPLTELIPEGCSKGVMQLVADCTKFDKKERIQSAAELISRL